VTRESFRAEIARMKREREAAIRRVMDALDASPAIIATSRWGDHDVEELFILSGEMSTPEYGKYRLTRFHRDGPVGHDVRNTIRELAEELRCDAVRPASEIEVIEWTCSREFIDGTQRVAYVQALNALSFRASKAGKYAEIFAPANDRARELVDAGKIEDATAYLTKIARSLPAENPAPTFVPNPAWVTKAIADSFETLESKVQPEWLPKLTEVRGRRGTLLASMREYGCGAYGCVLPTLDPKVVLKATTDPTELEFAVKVSQTLVVPVVVHYYLAIRLSATHNGHAIGLLWRESAQDVGQLDKHGPALEAISVQHRAATAALIAINEGRYDALRSLMDAWVATCHAMAQIPELAFAAHGLVRVWRDQRVFIADVHEGNLGRCIRHGKLTWVITDPGNVVIMTD
jgi:hypothetical protein